MKEFISRFILGKSLCIGIILTSSLCVFAAPKFSGLLLYIGQIILDPEISINVMADNEDFVELKGTAPNQLDAYLLAEKLFYSKMKKDFEFVDVIPFWENNSFTFILKKTSHHSIGNGSSFIRIQAPPIRKLLSNKLLLKGSCSVNVTEILISGDINGKTQCLKGSWEFQVDLLISKLPIIGVSISHRLINQKIIRDFRSFLLPRP